MSPGLLCLHLERSTGLCLDMVITDPHPATHSITCNEADPFRRFTVDDTKLSPVLGDAFPSTASHLEELRIDVHQGYPSLGFLLPIFDGSLPKLGSLQLRNVPFWSRGMSKGLKHLEFINGAQTLPLFVPLALVFIETWCILPHPRCACTVTTLPNLRRFRVSCFKDSPPHGVRRSPHR